MNDWLDGPDRHRLLLVDDDFLLVHDFRDFLGAISFDPQRLS